MRPLLLLGALLLAACGSLSGAASGGPSPSPSAPPANLLVVAADNGATLQAHVGDHIQIALGDQLNWRVDPADGTVLVHPIQNDLLVRGTQAIYLAAAPGTSTIKATGTAACPSGAACPLFAVLFSATVVVAP